MRIRCGLCDRRYAFPTRTGALLCACGRQLVPRLDPRRPRREVAV